MRALHAARGRTAIAKKDSASDVLPEQGETKGNARAARRPPPSSEAVRKRMKSTPQRDTPAELRVRRLLHAMGLRYTIDASPLSDSARRADIVFRRARVAVFVDGCFWHGCPVHVTWPRANARFWREKIHANMKRDADTNLQLERQGWIAIRIWEHEEAARAAHHVAKQVKARIDALRPLEHSRK